MSSPLVSKPARDTPRCRLRSSAPGTLAAAVARRLRRRRRRRRGRATCRADEGHPPRTPWVVDPDQIDLDVVRARPPATHRPGLAETFLADHTAAARSASRAGLRRRSTTAHSRSSGSARVQVGRRARSGSSCRRTRRRSASSASGAATAFTCAASGSRSGWRWSHPRRAPRAPTGTARGHARPARPAGGGP